MIVPRPLRAQPWCRVEVAGVAAGFVDTGAPREVTLPVVQHFSGGESISGRVNVTASSGRIVGSRSGSSSPAFPRSSNRTEDFEWR